MTGKDRQIRTVGLTGGLSTAGVWEAHLTFDNDEFIVVSAPSRLEALQNLRIQVEQEGLKEQFDRYLTQFPPGVLDDAPSSDEPPRQSEAAGFSYRLVSETGQSIASYDERCRRFPGGVPRSPSFDCNRAFQAGRTFEST